MKTGSKQTPYGKIIIANQEQILEKLLGKLEAYAEQSSGFSVGLTGGSTPKAFYQWVTEGNRLSEDIKQKAFWSVSDERMVPIESEESNFGNAKRMMLNPLGVSEVQTAPWPVQVDPHSAAQAFENRWEERFGPGKAFDLCFLGMGDDGHTASIFPGSPIFAMESRNLFCSVEVPGKGWRLTITPYGFSHCSEIVITVTGSGKADMLKQVLEGPDGVYPVQILKQYADRVTWLVDAEAASQIS